MPVAWLLAALMVLGAGCSTLPPQVDRPETRALEQNDTTMLGRLAMAGPNPSLSGVRLLISGEDALGSLVTLADRAERTIDLQYYLIRNDASTRTLLRRVFAAAERGVRVRMLIDDFNTAGEDESLLCLTRHPRLEVRLYNPLPAGRFSTITRVLTSLTDVKRINQRMHNKMFVADNAVAVTGGRNLGDAYFVQSDSSNFVDLDMLAAGPVVRALSASFDSFWNSPLAYPVTSIVTAEPKCAGAVSATPEPAKAPPPAAAGSTSTSANSATPNSATPNRAAPNNVVASNAAANTATMAQADNPATPAPTTVPGKDSVVVPPSALARDLAEGRLRLQWVPATVLADKPSKIGSDGSPDSTEIIIDDVAALIRAAQREVIVISPYFVPGKRGLELFQSLQQRGVKVRILTNSLAATDAPAVHAGYARYRTDLVRSGIELYELRPRLGATRTRIGSYGSSQSSLHAKALVIDRRLVLVGSMNMDPRSAFLNTEIGIVMRSPFLSEQLLRLYEDVGKNSSYRLELTSTQTLRWVSGTADVPSVEGEEPDASMGLRLLMKMLSPFAPEELL